MPRQYFLNKENLYVILGSILASIGFLKNDKIAIIGSMLVSPIVSVIIRHKQLISEGEFKKNFKSDIKEKKNSNKIKILGPFWRLLLLCSLCILTGWLCSVIYDKSTKEKLTNNIDDEEQYSEIHSRTKKMHNYMLDFIYAFIGGVCIYVAYSKSYNKLNSEILIGIGIGAALLPPLVNSGILFYLKKKDMGLNSLKLSFVNIGSIIFGIYIAMFSHGVKIRCINWYENKKSSV